MNKNLIRQSFESLLDFLFPPFCVGCYQEGVYLCDNCQSKIEKNNKQNCLSCGRLNNTGATCEQCRQKFFLDGAVAIFDYNHPIIQIAIKEYKYHFVKKLAEPLTRLLIEFWPYSQLLNEKTLISFVPLHWRRKNWRGFNQAELIAKILANYWRLDLYFDLKRCKNTRPQVNLSAIERLANVKDIFQAKGDLTNKKIILIDDVITTGATLNSCAKALKKIGAFEVWGLVLARG